MQRGFAAAIVDGDTRLAAYIDARDIAPAARLRIYRNAVFAIQAEALETSFPAVRRMLGEKCFDGLATRYAVRHGSRSGNLQDFGATFAVFLSAQAEVAAFSWVIAVAELEWLRQECALAAGWPRADAQALTAALLAGLPVRMQPHVRVLSARVPALDLW
ncbi:MAG: HvfC/BufC family peptide modification chaperone, partial [Rhodanobacteraceae bacterium]